MGRDFSTAQSTLHGHGIVRSLPAILLGPEKCEDGLRSDRQRGGRQVEDVDSEAGVARVGVVHGRPAVHAPVHSPGIEQDDAERFISEDAAGFVVESPAENLTDMFIDQITLDRLRRLVEDLVVANRTAKFYVFGVGPHQWAGGASGLSAEKFERGNVGSIPDLFGKEAAVSAGGIFHHCEERLGFVTVSASESVMTALAGEQGPGASDAGTVEGRAVFVFAVAVAVIAIPARALRQLDREQRVDGAKRIQYAGIVGGTQAKAHQRPSGGADDVVCALAVLTGGTILDGDEALRGRCRNVGVGRGDANVIA